MIRSFSSVDLDLVDYQVVKINSYSEAKHCKVLIIDEHTYDLLNIRELLVANPKLRLVLISDKPDISYYQVGIDYVVIDQSFINPIIHNLDSRHKLISRVQIKEDFNRVNVGGVDIRLTPKEMMIYVYLLNNRGKLCYRKEMLSDILGYHEDADSRVIDVYVKHLRTKLGTEGYKIETVRGKGYIYNE